MFKSLVFQVGFLDKSINLIVRVVVAIVVVAIVAVFFVVLDALLVEYIAFFFFLSVISFPSISSFLLSSSFSL